MFKYKLLVICFLAILNGCGGSDSPNDNSTSEDNETNIGEDNSDLVDDYDFSIRSNSTNVSVFNDVEVGSNTAIKSDIYKKVPVEIVTSPTELAASKIAHVTFSGFQIKWMLPIKNISPSTLCYVNTMYTDLLAGSAVIGSYSMVSVSGSIRYIPQYDSLNSSCLLPGEVGIAGGQVSIAVSEIENNFNQLTKIKIREISYSDELTEEVTGNVIGKFANPSSGGSYLSMEFENTGDTVIDLYAGYSKYFLLDESDNPIHWGFAYRGSGKYLVGTGETGNITAGSIRSVSYSGLSSSAVFVADFEYESN